MASAWMALRVDVNKDEVWDQLRDEEILSEMKSRRIGPQNDLLEELRRADPADFLTIAELMLSPKWTSAKACKEQYELEMGR